MRTVRLRVALLDVSPEVWRLVDVPAGLTLDELHPLLQAALGWTDSHLHQWVVDGTPYGPRDDEGLLEQGDESNVRLRGLAQLRYLYDFGDGWEHDVVVLGPGGERPGCLEGAGACPPEDVGGPPGYERLLQVLDDPQHPEHAELSDWAQHRPVWDLAATDHLVRQVAGEVPQSVRLVLDLLAEGATLTPRGRLPRVVVRAVQAQRPAWYPLRRLASVEEDLLPLLDLRDLLKEAGLLRLVKGVLRATGAAQDDEQVLRRLRGALAADPFVADLAPLVAAALSTGGPQDPEALARVLLPHLARWAVQGEPLALDSLREQLSRCRPLLAGLDLVDGDWMVWAAGPSALSLLPAAALLGAHRSV